MVLDQEEEVKRLTRKLIRLTPGGKRLNQDEAVDLAVYSILTGLNPFNAECYYMPNVGPIPGIAGHRVKTHEWLMAVSGNDPTVRTWEEFRPAEPGEADFDPDAGDIAVVGTLFDSVSKTRWLQQIMETAERYHKMGAEFKEARDAAMEDIGPCPSWSAVGVVKASEHFSGFEWEDYQSKKPKLDADGNKIWKPEMWDRYERAKKRAIKGAYRKGFPSVRLPDPEYGDVIDAVAVEVKQQIIAELEAENSRPRKSEPQILGELGYEQPTETKFGEQEFWALVNKLQLDNVQGAEILHKFGGDYNAAYQETAKNLPPE